MEMVLTRDQLVRVILLAENYRHDGGMNAYGALYRYMENLGYEAVLDVEVLMDYGTELMYYSDAPDPIGECYRYIRDRYGDGNGDIDLAIGYITGKLDLSQRLTTALENVTITGEGKISFEV